MMSSVIFLLVLGLIIFGPKKTLEFAQEIGRLIAHMKRAAD
jgi:Sec-independent protein translocase protein TatA